MFPDMSAIEDEFSGEKHRLIISMTSDAAELPKAMQQYVVIRVGDKVVRLPKLDLERLIALE
jgi:hypothetical protein